MSKGRNKDKVKITRVVTQTIHVMVTPGFGGTTEEFAEWAQKSLTMGGAAFRDFLLIETFGDKENVQWQTGSTVYKVEAPKKD